MKMIGDIEKTYQPTIREIEDNLPEDMIGAEVMYRGFLSVVMLGVVGRSVRFYSSRHDDYIHEDIGVFFHNIKSLADQR